MNDTNELTHCIFQAPDIGHCYEASLVLTARDIDNAILPMGSEPLGARQEWGVWVAVSAVNPANAELQAYAVENRPRAPSARKPVEFDSGWYGVLGFLLVIWSIPWLQSAGWTGLPAEQWVEQGRLQVGLVGQGQWWRTVTALTLHGDLAHIASNSVFGLGFGLFLGRYLGSGFGWLLVLVGGIGGNALNAWLRPDSFSSIGASTANFALLGLMGTFMWRRGYLRQTDWRRSFAPVVAALALLSMLGVGGERTDVLAHFTGFFCGALLGLWAPSVNVPRLGISGQWLSGGIALAIIALAWRVALT